ncbi:MAG TPA: prepilin-type N-terminal cleavage/methylation domain-containing protein, partial [Firmicutes bacterium]|nr:prepilin-type N-terminal cleavage/methylation domain-containing protein [Bacillota bacterium]
MLKKIRKMLKSQEGFTLVELMIVVVILGILAGIGIQQYGQIQERAREGVDEANVRLIKSAAQMYLMAEKDIEIGDDQLQVLVDANYLEDMIYSPRDSNEHYVVK